MGGGPVNPVLPPSTAAWLDPARFERELDGKPVRLFTLRNRQGMVVGSAMWGANRRAAIWKQGRVRDLNNYACVRHSGWVLRQATGINDRGDIVGNGTNPEGRSAAFKMVQRPLSGLN